MVSGWTVEQAVQHLFLKDGEIDRGEAEQLEREAYAGNLAHAVDNVKRLERGEPPLPDPLSCPVWGEVHCEGRGIPYSLRRGDKWLGAAGLRLKQKLLSGEFSASGCAGAASAAVQEIVTQQWDGVGAFDTFGSIALDRDGKPLFCSLRIFIQEDRKPRLRWLDYYDRALRRRTCRCTEEAGRKCLGKKQDRGSQQ